MFTLYYILFAYIIEKDEKNIIQSFDGKILFVLKRQGQNDENHEIYTVCTTFTGLMDH